MSPEQQGNHHRSALLACQPDTKCHMAGCLIFRKEDNFCMTFLVGCQLADTQVVGQMAQKFNRK